MPKPDIGSVPFQEAIDHFADKSLVLTKRWDQILGEQHARAFTIAGVTEVEILNDFHKAILDIRKRGGTLNDFRKAFDDIVARSGWDYKGDRGWRTKVIYQTNLRTANAAGRWEQIARRQAALEEREPGETLYIAYRVLDNAPNRRDQHQAWQTVILPVGHPWWDSHYPPNGWGCACYVVVYTQRQLERKGLKVTENPPTIRRTERINKATGEVYPPTPEGIDVGFDHNHGKSQYFPKTTGIADDRLGKRVADLTVDSADFINLVEGNISGNATVGHLPKGVPELIDSKTASVTLSDQTIAKQLASNSDLTVKDYQVLPDLFNNGLIIQDGDRTLVFFHKGKQLYQATVKSTRDGTDLQVTSLVKSNAKELRRMRKKGEVLREEI